MPVIYFTVTTDLTYDQRMIRICSSLAAAGFDVTLVGRRRRNSLPLSKQRFQQKRIYCLFDKGKLFYAEYNLRLFFFLLFKKMDAICAIDLDTIVPVYLLSRLKKCKRVYDAHELFCEMKEIVSRPSIYRVWKWIERHTVPNFKYGYTVNQQIAKEFSNMYEVSYEVVRSIAPYDSSLHEEKKSGYVLYQGAVNEGRSFETLLPAMRFVDSQLVICGDGNFMEQAKRIVEAEGLQQKIIFKGMLQPGELRRITSAAKVGITLFESGSKSNYFSLANRFFDYIHSGVPQVCVNYPVYSELNNVHEVAVLIDDLAPLSIAAAINSLLNDEVKWNRLHQNCLKAAKDWNWQNEEKHLIQFYKKLFE